jgi:hypothetical protein
MEEQGLFKAPVANHQTGRSYIPTESDICVWRKKTEPLQQTQYF